MAKKRKEIKIETIEDIFKVITSENLDRFLMDFYCLLDGMIKVKERVPDVQKTSF